MRSWLCLAVAQVSVASRGRTDKGTAFASVRAGEQNPLGSYILHATMRMHRIACMAMPRGHVTIHGRHRIAGAAARRGRARRKLIFLKNSLIRVRLAQP
eukprot:SAG31_NODE_720_length_12587_cov_15.393114_10_plen_99_part_00